MTRYIFTHDAEQVVRIQLKPGLKLRVNADVAGWVGAWMVVLLTDARVGIVNLSNGHVMKTAQDLEDLACWLNEFGDWEPMPMTSSRFGAPEYEAPKAIDPDFLVKTDPEPGTAGWVPREE